MYNNIILTESISENICVFHNFRAVCGRTNNQLLDISLYHYIGLVSGWQDQTLGYVQLSDNYHRHVMQLVLLQFHLFLCSIIIPPFLFFFNIFLSYNTISGYLQERSHNNLHCCLYTRFFLWIQAQIYVIIQDLWN